MRNPYMQQKRPFSYMQEGGMQDQQQDAAQQPQEQPQPQGGGDQMGQLTQAVAQMLQQGTPPDQILQKLVEAGVPQDQAQQIIQMVMQQMQGQQDPNQGPAMRMGGYFRK